MARWVDHRMQKKTKSSLLTHISDAHKEQVAKNRQYLRVIIETLLFTAKQNIAQRGHNEDRHSIQLLSDTNRGNFLELLSLRANDLPWLSTQLKSKLKHHKQWTSPRIQNELLDIIGELVKKKYLKMSSSVPAIL